MSQWTLISGLMLITEGKAGWIPAAPFIVPACALTGRYRLRHKRRVCVSIQGLATSLTQAESPSIAETVMAQTPSGTVPPKPLPDSPVRTITALCDAFLQALCLPRVCGL